MIMTSSSETFDLEYFIRKSPESVKAWWTDLPDDYQATDPEEEPFRIVTLRKFANGRELLTFWHARDASVEEFREILWLREDGSWIFEATDYPGFIIRSEYWLRLAPNGVYLHISTLLTPLDTAHASRMSAEIESLTEFFKGAAEICERNAR